MNGLFQNLRRRGLSSSEQLTVFWSDTGAAFLRWFVPLDGCPCCTGFARLPVEQCNAQNYCQSLGRLIPPLRSRALSVQWLLLGEPALILRQANQRGASLPGWIEACWQGIPEQLLPDAIEDGIDTLEKRLRGWPAFSRNGHGCFLVLERRACFFAFANGEIFRRISRHGDEEMAASLVLDEDWMRQTRMLFNGRTGLDIRKVLIPQHMQGKLPSSRFGLEYAACQPKDWPESGRAGHTLQFLAQPAPVRDFHRQRLHYAGLQQRIASREQTSLFRAASCILLGGWLLLLLGACRSGEPDAHVQSGLHQRWEAAALRWEQSNNAWSLKDEEKKIREAPFILTGSILQSVPDGIELHRIHLSDGDGIEKGVLAVTLEGTSKGGEKSPQFRNWIRDLQGREVLLSVENLRFNRRKDWIQFQISGPGNPGGSE
ncbi:MAG: hypothetical protein AB3N64_07865 [Puniceicoccaceae bacterium]